MKKLAFSNRLLSLESKHEQNDNDAPSNGDSVYYSSDGPSNSQDSVYYAPDGPTGPDAGAMSYESDYDEDYSESYEKDHSASFELKYSHGYGHPPISAHISYNEATRSATAKKHGISNDPGPTELKNMKIVAEKVFEPMRNHFGRPITISSFYRSPELNKLVKGSPTSDHMSGHAIDIDVDGLDGITNAQIFYYIKDNLQFDQLIWEKGNSSNPSWVHVSYKEGANRNQVLRYDGSSYKPFSAQQSYEEGYGYYSDAHEVYDEYEEISSEAFNDPFADIKSAKFKKFLPQILKFEGGFVNDPDDPGGATNKGITIGTFKRHAQTVLGIQPTLENLKNITDGQAGQIYELIYWNKLLAEDINDVQVAYQYVDFYINAGSNAIKVMQRSLNGLGQNVAVDGGMGPKTLAAINAVDGEQLFDAFKKNRQKYYNDLATRRPKMKKFLGGWTKRTNHFVYQKSMMGTSLAHTQSGLLTHVNGWLRVKLNSGKIVSLSQFARVSGVGSSGNRETFTIDDWPYSGQGASVSKQSGGASRFGSVSYQNGGKVVFDSARNKLKFGSSAWIPTAMDPSNPMAKGTYKIWVPDYPHGGGGGYSSHSIYSTVWFRLGGQSSSRYLHLGNYSAGCVTFGATSAGGTNAHKAQWTDLYNYLIKRRIGNGGNYVGELEVI